MTTIDQNDEGSNQELAQQRDQAPMHRTGMVASPAYLLQIAVESGKDLAYVERLMQMQKEWDATQAEKAYFKAFAAYAATPVEIKKTVYVEHFDGYHADLGNIAAAVRAAMGPHGLSFTWDIENAGNEIRGRCIISHEGGHSVEGSWMTAPPDDSGSKNTLQAIGSTRAYIKRYTLTAAAGVEAEGMDDDGQSSGKPQTSKITEDQINTLDSMVRDNDLDMTAILNWIKTTTKEASFASINSDQYDTVHNIIQKKINANPVDREREPGEDG